MIDFSKIDIVKPMPKWLCLRMHKECTYCKFDVLHPSVTSSEWSSEEWDGDKAKARENTWNTYPSIYTHQGVFT